MSRHRIAEPTGVGARPSPRCALLLVSALLATSSRDAFAGEGVDVEIAAREGYGTNPSELSTNPLGLGFGARAGVAASGWYAGLSAIEYAGGTNLYAEHALLYGLEGGYGVKLGETFELRPRLGAGLFTDTGGDFAHHFLYLEPGALGLVWMGNAFVGVDANLLTVPGAPGYGHKSNWLAGTFNAQIGFRL